MKENLLELNRKDNSEESSLLSAPPPIYNLSNLIIILKKKLNEGNSLFKQNKIEEAKIKFKEGLEKFEEKSSFIEKEKDNNIQYNKVLYNLNLLLSKLSSCYYKQGLYKESIEYDLKIIENNPKYGKSLSRLFNSYTKLNNTKKALFYGDLLLQLDEEEKNKFKNIISQIEEEKLKLNKKKLMKFIIPGIVLLLAVIIFFIFKKIKVNHI